MKSFKSFSFIAAIILVFVFAVPLAGQDVVQANKAVVLSYLESVYVKQDLDSAAKLLTENVIFHDPIWYSRDINGFVINYRQLYDRISDFKITPYAVIGEGLFVVVPYVWEGSKSATEPRAAHEPLSGNAVEVFRVVDGKITEIWRQYELHDFSILGTSEDYRSMVTVPLTIESPFSITVDTTQPTNVDTNRRVVLKWIDNYNNGKLDTSLMHPTFLYHSCPCGDVGTIDLKIYAENFRQLKENGLLKQMTPISHNLGLTVVSEGELTVVLYDMHEAKFGSQPDEVAIFRTEDGKIADIWDF